MIITKTILRTFCLSQLFAFPIMISLHYEWMQAQNAYPPHSDTIAIPILSNIVFWFVWAPIVFFIIWSGSKAYKPPLNLFIWDNQNHPRSILITVLFLFPVVMCILSLPYKIRWNNYVSIINSIWWAIIWLIMRTVWIEKK